jgi:membrane-bound lytic murein transglycosylase A
MAGPAFRVAVVALVLGLAACEAEKAEPPAPEEIPSGLRLDAATFAELPGWAEDDLGGAAQALARSCERLKRLPADRDVGSVEMPTTAAEWWPACDAVLVAGTDPVALRAALEASYEPFLVLDRAEEADPEAAADGLFTGYFEAELTGSRVRDATFATPLYGRPGDLVQVNLGSFDPDLAGKGIVGVVRDGRLVPYLERGAIEAGALDDQDLELLWIDDPVDVFLLHVQGSGRVILPDGDVVRVGFAAHNGHGYRSIGRKLIDDGELEAHEASWPGIRGWVEANPDKAADLFAHNPRFIFFRELTGDGPIGAEGVALTPERSLAVDTRYIPLGAPIWLDTTRPGVGGDPLRRLMVAQDKGGAIKGVVRGDFFWGYGDAALAEAGRMKSRGRYFVLLPKGLAERIKATS